MISIINLRRHAAAVTLAMLAGSALSAASPARAEWTEWKRGCSYTCHWYLAGGTCSGPFGVKVPCPIKKKRCNEDNICRQSSH
jgi:hypothetical protein